MLTAIDLPHCDDVHTDMRRRVPSLAKPLSESPYVVV
jgi:hypothetical protein